MKRILGCLFCLLTISMVTQAQSRQQEVSNVGQATLINFGYGIQIPAGDLADRFGSNFGMEVSVDRLTKKNWLYGIQGQYFFGSEVKEDVLANLRTAQGLIIANDRAPADIQLRERGYYLGLRFGKLIGIAPKNPRSGLKLSLGGGLLSHRIRIQQDPVRTVTQLKENYVKGYDRLSNGFALHQYVGYQVLGRDGGVNFSAGFEFFQGFTQNRRSFNFDTRMQDDTKRLDLLIGFRLAWTLPYYAKAADEIYY